MVKSICDFFENITKQKCLILNPGVCKSEYLEDFYNDCVKDTLPEVEVVKKWHNLLKRYINDPEAVFFVRRYASGKDKEGKWDIRRGFLTVFNNIKLVYVDNFFAQYFYAMAKNGFVPGYDDFKQFILNRKMPYGYSVVSLERDHQAYLKGHTYPLNKNGWKHSHVFSANQNDYNFNYKKIATTLFPKGEYDDFIIHDGSDYPYRRVEQTILEEDVKRMKAHFLRVVHPINYFLTPKVELQSSSEGIKDIGEYPDMIALMKYNLNGLYGKVFAEYQEMIMATSSTVSPKNPYIGLSYGKGIGEASSIAKGHFVEPTLKRAYSKGGVTPFSMSYKPISGKSLFTPEQIANCIKAYLFDGMSFRNIEQICLEMPKRVNGGGFEAKKLLNSMDIDNSMKKQFHGKTIDEAIYSATEPLKSTLIRMKADLIP